MKKEKIKWYFNRLKSMDIKEVVWRVEQKTLEKKEKQIFNSSRPQVIDEIFNKELVRLKSNFKYENLGLNFHNNNYSISNKLWLFDNYIYDDVKNNWSYGFNTENNWPNIFSYDIDYKQNDEIGDARTNWELNRHFQFTILAKNYFITKDLEYYNELKVLFYDWNRRNTFLIGISWTSVMEIAIRAYSWIVTLSFLIAANIEDSEDIINDFKFGIINMIDYCNNHHSRYSSANNHLIIEMFSIGVAGVMFENKEWYEKAIDVLNKELFIQNYKDGVNKEHALHYQSFVMEAVLLLMLIFKRNNITYPSEWYKLMYNMSSFIKDNMDSRYQVSHLGDDDNGKHRVLVIELKQWSRDGIEYYANKGFPAIKVNATNPYLSRHPVNQTKEYTDALIGNHSNVVNGQLSVSGCQYLHEFELGEKNFFIQDRYSDIDISMMFVKGEEKVFADYLKSVFSPFTDNELARNLFIEGDYVTTEMDMEIINRITESPDNIPLWHDQSKILDYIMPLLKQQAEGKLRTKHMIVIAGAAGTGKTIVGFRILAEYWRLHPNANNNYKCKYTLPRSRTIKQVLDGLCNDQAGIRAVFLDSIRGQYDLLVIDEAHRITKFNNSISSAQIVIVLQDDRQRVRGNEIGTKDNFKTFARRNGYTFTAFSLEYQKRSGLGSYVDRLDRLLYGKEYLNDVGLGIEVTVCDNIQDMELWMNNCHNTTTSIKYYASYCWEWKSKKKPTEIDIKIPKINPVFQKQWNPMYNQYDWYLDSIDKVGCIYTAQGLGFDYVGFIWWDDLVWRTDHWESHIDKVTRYDEQLRDSITNNTNAQELLLNIYRVMLTRAKKGLCIWFEDAETKKHFKEVCLLEE